MSNFVSLDFGHTNPLLLSLIPRIAEGGEQLGHSQFGLELGYEVLIGDFGRNCLCEGGAEA